MVLNSETMSIIQLICIHEHLSKMDKYLRRSSYAIKLPKIEILIRTTKNITIELTL